MTFVAHWMKPFLSGHCYDFTLALAEKVNEPVFVAIGDARFPEHVALRVGGRFADVRGLLEEAEFRRTPGSRSSTSTAALSSFTAASRAWRRPTVACAKIAAARKAVKLAFPDGVPPTEPSAPAPGLR